MIQPVGIGCIVLGDGNKRVEEELGDFGSSAGVSLETAVQAVAHSFSAGLSASSPFFCFQNGLFMRDVLEKRSRKRVLL